jgi:anti-sigma factor RsiW
MTAEELRILLTGYLDGELDAEQRARVEAALAEDPELRSELEEMRQLKNLTTGIGIDARADADLRRFWNDVYNRLERHTAWILLLGGVLMLVAAALFFFFRSPETPGVLKASVACAAVGVLLMLWSVWRERRKVLPHDRYSREVHR